MVDRSERKERQMRLGRHKLPVKAELRKAIGKQAGEVVSVHLEERIEGRVS
jgi:hypothetical protein